MHTSNSILRRSSIASLGSKDTRYNFGLARQISQMLNMRAFSTKPGTLRHNNSAARSSGKFKGKTVTDSPNASAVNVLRMGKLRLSSLHGSDISMKANCSSSVLEDLLITERSSIGYTALYNGAMHDLLELQTCCDQVSYTSLEGLEVPVYEYNNTGKQGINSFFSDKSSGISAGLQVALDVSAGKKYNFSTQNASKSARAALQSVVYPVLRIVDAVRAPIAADMYSNLVFPSVKKHNMNQFYEQVLRTLSKAPHVIPSEAVGVVLGFMAKDDVELDVVLGDALLGAVANSTDVGMLINLLEVGFEMKNAKGYRAFRTVCGLDKVHDDDVKMIFGCSGDDLTLVLTRFNFAQHPQIVPMLYQFLSSSGFDVDSKIITATASALIRSNNLTHIPSLLKHAQSKNTDAAKLGEQQLGVIVKALLDCLDANVQYLQANVPAPFTEAFSVGTEASTRKFNVDGARVFPTCTLDVISTEASKAIYHTTAPQVHTYIVYCRIIQSVLTYLKSTNTTMSTLVSKRLIDLMVRLGLHSEAIALFKKSVKHNFFKSVAIDKEDSENTLVTVLFDEFESCTRHYFHPTFPNRKLARKMYVGEDFGEVPHDIAMKLRQGLNTIANTSGVDDREKLYAQVLYLHSFKDLKKYPAFQRKICEDIHKHSLPSDNEDHANVTFHHSRSLLRTLVDYAPESLKQEMKLEMPDNSVWFAELSSQIQSPEDAISVLPRIPSRDMGLFNYEGVHLQTPDSSVIEMIMTITKNGCFHESVVLLELILNFTRLNAIISKHDGDGITDPVILKKLINFSNLYGVQLPGLDKTGAIYELSQQSKLRELCSSFQFHVEHLTALASLVSQCTSFTDAQYLYRTLAQALGLRKAETPQFDRKNDQIDHVAQLSALIMSQSEDIHADFTNSHKYRMITAHQLSTTYDVLNNTIEAAEYHENAPLTSTLFNQNGEIDLQYGQDTMHMFSFLNHSNVCTSSGQPFDSQEFVNSIVHTQDLGLEEDLQNSLKQDFTPNTVANAVAQTSIDLMNMGVLRYFNSHPYEQQLPIYALAQNTAMRALKTFLHSFMMDQSLLVVKEQVNLTMVQNEQFAQKSITSVGRCIMSEVPLYTGHSSPYRARLPQFSVDGVLQEYHSYYPQAAMSFGLVGFISRCLHFDGSALDILDRSRTGKREDITAASLSRLLTASEMDFTTVPVAPVKADITEVHKLSLVEAYGLLTSAVNPGTNKFVPQREELLSQYPDLNRISVQNDSAGNRGVVGEQRRAAMVRVQRGLGHSYSEQVYSLTKLHLASTLFPIIEEGVGLRGTITHVIRLIHGGQPETAFHVQKKAALQASVEDLSLLQSVIYAYEQSNRGDYVLRLFKELVYRNVHLTQQSKFDISQVTHPKIDVTRETVSLYRSIVFSDTPLHDVLVIMQYLASIQGHISVQSSTQAMLALVRCGYQKEALDLFMVVCHPEYISNIALASYDKTIKSIMKSNNSETQHAKLMARQNKFKPLHAAMRTAFIPTKVEEYVRSEREVNYGMSATKTRVHNRIYDLNKQIIQQDTMPVDTLQTMCSKLAMPSAAVHEQNNNLLQPVYISENMPYAHRSGVADVDPRSADTVSEKQAEFAPSPFLMSLLHLFKPCSMDSARQGVKVAAVNEEVQVAALRVCGDGEHAYSELAYQVFLAFNHQASPTITIPKSHPAEPSKQLAEFTNLLQSLGIKDMSNLTNLQRKVDTERHLQGQAETKGFGAGLCELNGHTVMTEAEALASGRHLYQNCSVPKGVVFDCRYGDTQVLSQDRTFWIPNVSSPFNKMFDKYLYNAWVHHFAPAVGEFRCVGGNQVNNLLHSLMHEDKEQIQDRQVNEAYIDSITLYEFQYKHATQFKDVLGLPYAQNFTHAPRDLCWLDKVALQRYRSLPDLLSDEK